MRTVVLFPTAGEAEAFRRRCPGVAYRITGVGPAAAAAATARAIVDERPDLLLLAGIAGVYPASEVAVGEVVAVAEERVEGLPERYADVYRPTFAVPGLRTAVSNSVARSGRHLPEPRWRTWRGRRSSPSLRRWAYRPPRCVPSPTAWENPSACGA